MITPKSMKSMIRNDLRRRGDNEFLTEDVKSLTHLYTFT